MVGSIPVLCRALPVFPQCGRALRSEIPALPAVEVPSTFLASGLGGVVGVAEGPAVPGVVRVAPLCEEVPAAVGVVVGVECPTGGVSVVAVGEGAPVAIPGED